MAVPMLQSGLPSPLAGEGASRSEAGEGLPPNANVKSSSQLKSFAKKLRRNQTEAEATLWRALRNRSFTGFKFRRQVPIGPYVADFVCLNARLIVEFDGSQHAESEHDRLRDRWFADADFRVLRVWNNELKQNRDGVLAAIWEALRRPSPGADAPPSPEMGEGTTELKLQSGIPLPLAGEGASRSEVGEGRSLSSEKSP
jgi:very-short-patch-repair endonuclease